MSDTYTCSACGTFEKGWSDDEAWAELGASFPGHAAGDCNLVCDDCYQATMIGWHIYRGMVQIVLGIQLAKWRDDTVAMIAQTAVIKMCSMTPKELAAAVEASEPSPIGHS